MSSLSALERALQRELHKYHVRAQIQRFVGGALTLFALQVLTGGLTEWNTKAVVAAIVGALWAAARESWPTLPWAIVQQQLRAARDAEAQKPPAGPASKPGGVSG